MSLYSYICIYVCDLHYLYSILIRSVFTCNSVSLAIAPRCHRHTLLCVLNLFCFSSLHRASSRISHVVHGIRSLFALYFIFYLRATLLLCSMFQLIRRWEWVLFMYAIYCFFSRLIVPSTSAILRTPNSYRFIFFLRISIHNCRIFF